MGAEYFWPAGMWIFPLTMIVVMLVVMYLFFGRGGFLSRCCGADQEHGSPQAQESALDILFPR